MQEDATLALMPRLRRWASLAGLADADIRRGVAAALRALTGTAPAIWVAVVKSWIDGWPT